MTFIKPGLSECCEAKMNGYPEGQWLDGRFMGKCSNCAEQANFPKIEIPESERTGSEQTNW